LVRFRGPGRFREEFLIAREPETIPSGRHPLRKQRIDGIRHCRSWLVRFRGPGRF
jgi:hypothetical protein